jgi:hypothetical protein
MRPSKEDAPSAWFSRVETDPLSRAVLRYAHYNLVGISISNPEWAKFFKKNKTREWESVSISPELKGPTPLSFQVKLVEKGDVEAKDVPAGGYLVKTTKVTPSDRTMSVKDFPDVYTTLLRYNRAHDLFTKEERLAVEKEVKNSVSVAEPAESEEPSKASSDAEEEPVVQKEIKLPEPKKIQEGKSFKEAARTLEEKMKSCESFVRTTYATEISNGSLSEKEVQALVYILGRVPLEVSEVPKSRTPSRLYDWAVVRATISFPYYSLKQAADNAKISKEFGYKAPWGLIDDGFVLPSKESIDDDETFWGKIYDLLTYMGEKVTFSAQKGETVPDISSTALAKNNYFGRVFVRLVELLRAPNSATIRGGDRLTELDLAKNHVDYVLLSLILAENKEHYGNLQLSYEATLCQRAVVSQRPVLSKKGKTEIVSSTSRTGYVLADLLGPYIETKIGKSPEAEPFFRFILEIIKKIITRIPKDYVLPKSLFAPVSVSVRKYLRHGPEIQAKGKTKPGRTYVPFSFAKSSICDDMPETVRKTMTTAGSNVSKYIDQVNNFDVFDQNVIYPRVVRYVQLCYTTSDELRKAWQKNGLVLAELDEFRKRFEVDPFPTVQAGDKFLDALEAASFKMRSLHTDKSQQAKLLSKLAGTMESRRASRKAKQ